MTLQPPSFSVLAADFGYGNMAVCAEGATRTLQSSITRPRSVGHVAQGMRMAAEGLEVQFEGYRFMVGPGSWHWGEPLSSMDYTALAAPERQALFYGTLAPLLTPGATAADLLVIGLPVPLLQDTTQSETVLNGLRRYKGHHAFEVNHTAYELDLERIKILPQPVGAYTDWLIDDELHQRSGHGLAKVGVLDIGMNTLDLFGLQGGKVEPRYVGGGKVGVRRLLEAINATGHDLEELDHSLRTGRLRPTPAQLNSWLGEILSAVERTWSDLRRFSAVIPCGGGATVLGDTLRLALIAKGAIVHWPADPLLANVRGLWKWGTRVSHH